VSLDDSVVNDCLEQIQRMTLRADFGVTQHSAMTHAHDSVARHSARASPPSSSPSRRGRISRLVARLLLRRCRPARACRGAGGAAGRPRARPRPRMCLVEGTSTYRAERTTTNPVSGLLAPTKSTKQVGNQRRPFLGSWSHMLLRCWCHRPGALRSCVSSCPQKGSRNDPNFSPFRKYSTQDWVLIPLALRGSHLFSR